MKTNMRVINGDITSVEVEAIVNPSNLLYNVGAVLRAINIKAGPELKREYKQILKKRNNEPLNPGEAIITKGYNLPAKHVIFTSGIFWNGGNASEKECLYNCYINSLELAIKNKLSTIAFPLIGAGVDEVPSKIAEEVAMRAFKDFVNRYPNRLEKIILVKYRGKV